MPSRFTLKSKHCRLAWNVRFGPILLKKDFEGGSPSNIDSRRVPNEQHRFKNPFARIRLFQILIPQLRFGDFFNTIDQWRDMARLIRLLRRRERVTSARPKRWL
jgi:hypothetical protein